jgi:outer membrane protein assembly factor BamB
MMARCQACVAIGFTLVAVLSSQMIVDRLGSATSRSFADTAPELKDQQSVVSDRSGELLSSDGTMYGVSLRRTRVYDEQGLQEPKSLLWKTSKLFPTKTGEGTPSIPDPLPPQVPIYHGAFNIITANKEAYFIKRVSDGDSLFVIDLQTGETKRILKLLGGDFSGPVVAGALLFVGEGKGSLYAFDRRDWKMKWEIDKKGYYAYGSAPAVADGIVYFGGALSVDRQQMRENGSIYAVDANTGKQKWRVSIEGNPTAIAVADEVIYFGDVARRLFAVNAKNGKEIWRFKASDNIWTPAIMDGRAFFSDHGGNLYAVDLKEGKTVWKAAKKNKVATALAAYNKSVYYGGRENSLYAVDALTGEEKWVYRTEKLCIAPVAANGVIYVACLDNTILAIDAESGQEKWKYKTPHSPVSYPVVGNGVIYYLDEEGIMYAVGSS